MSDDHPDDGRYYDDCASLNDKNFEPVEWIFEKKDNKLKIYGGRVEEGNIVDDDAFVSHYYYSQQRKFKSYSIFVQ